MHSSFSYFNYNLPIRTFHLSNNAIFSLVMEYVCIVVLLRLYQYIIYNSSSHTNIILHIPLNRCNQVFGKLSQSARVSPASLTANAFFTYLATPEPVKLNDTHSKSMADEVEQVGAASSINAVFLSHSVYIIIQKERCKMCLLCFFFQGCYSITSFVPLL